MKALPPALAAHSSRKAVEASHQGWGEGRDPLALPHRSALPLSARTFLTPPGAWLAASTPRPLAVKKSPANFTCYQGPSSTESIFHILHNINKVSVYFHAGFKLIA